MFAYHGTMHLCHLYKSLVRRIDTKNCSNQPAFTNFFTVARYNRWKSDDRNKRIFKNNNGQVVDFHNVPKRSAKNRAILQGGASCLKDVKEKLNFNSYWNMTGIQTEWDTEKSLPCRFFLFCLMNRRTEGFPDKPTAPNISVNNLHDLFANFFNDSKQCWLFYVHCSLGFD